MGHRDITNIPIEILRTVESVARTGSFTKAAEQLGLSQPAISSQMKRIQSIVGGPLFHKTAAGTAPNERGKLVIALAQKILTANDQLVRLGGSTGLAQPLRLGMTPLYVSLLLTEQAQDRLSNVAIHVDSSKRIAEGLFFGYLDVVCLPLDGERPANILAEFEEASVWVRSKDFVLSPGAPIPLISSPEAVYGELMIHALDIAQLSYRVALSCNDYTTKISAVQAGLGVSAMPERLVPPSLVIAQEYYLPPLAPLHVILATRSGFDIKGHESLVEGLTELFSKEQVVSKPRLMASS